jgi:virginiamycin B lyase
VALRCQFPLALAGTLAVAACAGSHGTGGFTPQALQASNASVVGLNPATVAMTYSIKIPAAKAAAATAAQVHENFVSASTQSIEFQVYKVKKAHSPATLISTAVVALNVGAKGCTGTGARTCTGTIDLPPPSVDIVATTYDRKPARKMIPKNAKQLAIASIAGQAVKAGKKLAFTLGGIPATFTMTIPGATLVNGVQTASVYGMAPSSSNISIKVYDADGNFIVTDGYVNAVGKSTGVAMLVKASQASCTVPVLQEDTNAAGARILVAAPPKSGVFFHYGASGIAAPFSTPGYCRFGVVASLASNGVQNGNYVLDGPQLNEYRISSSSSPGAITVGPDNNIWFVDLNSVGTINVTTKAIKEYPVSSSPQAIISNGGNLWINAYENLFEMSTAGTVVHDFTNTPSGGPNNQMVLGPDGNFWFTESVAEKVAKISLTGALTEYSVPGAPEPSGIAAADGQLWFTTTLNQGISSITTSGTQKNYTLPGFPYPFFMVAGPDGNLWFGSCNGTMNRVAVPTSSTLVPAVFTVPESAGPGRVRGIAAGSNGDMWGADAAGNLDRIPLTATDSSDVTAVKVSEMAQWLTPGPDGAMWFTEATSTGNGKIGRLVP